MRQLHTFSKLYSNSYCSMNPDYNNLYCTECGSYYNLQHMITDYSDTCLMVTTTPI